MDEAIDNFFNKFEGPKKGQRLAPKPANEFKRKAESNNSIDFKREKKGTEYSEKYQKEEENKLLFQTLNAQSACIKFESDDDEAEEVAVEQQELPQLTVFDRYNFNLIPKDLPILHKRAEILKAIHEHSVVVVTATTGSGKTTQVPQYILEEAAKKKENCNIIVTQPRRMAAITNAERVASERQCEIGTIVGYQVGLDKKLDTKINSDTRILYCTTGVLLQKLITMKTLKQYTHIILDEAHERDLEMDMLLIVVRRLFGSKNPYIKVVLMSATMNAEKFSNYFKTIHKTGEQAGAPILDLNIKRPFPVKIDYLDGLQHLLATTAGAIVNFEQPGISHEMYRTAVNIIEFLVTKIGRKFENIKPSFLVFLPGIHEINRFRKELYKPKDKIDITKFQLSILHSTIPVDDYRKAFDMKVDNKIILATNIAESSITLPGVQFVIDFCLTKYQVTDTSTNMSQLKTDWASKTSLEQRAGRVGRTEIGQVVRLVFKDQYKNLPIETVPEMQRVSLESVVLKAKQLQMGTPSQVLGLALDPPPRNAITDSILVLKEIGGLTRISKKDKFTMNDGELTFAGHVMARLPVDVRVSKLIILGYMFSCLEECIIIGAGMSSKSIFKVTLLNSQEKMGEYARKLEYAEGSGSDAITTLNVYRKWRKEIEKGLKGNTERFWCTQQHLDQKSLKDMHELVTDIEKRLTTFRISLNDNSFRYRTEEKLCVIKICIAGAFYPNYFMFGGTPPCRDEYRLLNDLDPCSTVYFKGMTNRNGLSKIYEQQIREILCAGDVADEIDDMKIHFNTTSDRFQVEFKPASTDIYKKVPGEVKWEVYMAVKFRNLDRSKLTIKMMSFPDELAFAVEENLGEFKSGRFEMFKKYLDLEATKSSIYPKLNHREIPGKVTHIVSCGKFFFQPERGRKNLERIQGILQKEYFAIQDLEQALNEELLLVKQDNMIKRAKIIEKPDDGEEDFEVLLVDFGEIIKVNFNDLYNFPFKYIFQLPPQCFECKLSEVIPSAVNCPSGWTDRATEEFKKFIDGRGLEVKVNSFVNRVASVHLVAGPCAPGTCENLNQQLVMLGFAQQSDDSYMFRCDQLNRKIRRTHAEYREIAVGLEDTLVDDKINPPPAESLTESLKLDGPFSPLESKVSSLCQNAPSMISIDQSSVNSVLFDPFPNDPSEKVLVACSMTKRDQQVTLQQTTIMPHMRGMACLLGLMFSPIAEVRASSKKDRYTSIFTGLGCNENQKPHYGEHDCLIDVDVEFSEKDFLMINELRSCMSSMMRCEPNYGQPNVLGREKIADRDRICLLLKTIIASDDPEERSPLGVAKEPKNWRWADYIKIEKKVEGMYPELAPREELNRVTEETRNSLKKHAKELQEKARINSSDELIHCRLCEENIEKIVDLQMHVRNSLHKKRVMRIRDETK